MKRNFNYFIVAIFFWIICPMEIDAQVKIYKNPNFSEIKAHAKKLSKRILILCSTSWCAPCKELEEVYFKDSILANYLHSNFILATYDMEIDYGKTIAKKFGVVEYPTAIIVDSKGFFYYRLSGITSDPLSYLKSLLKYDSLFESPVTGISIRMDLRFPGFYNMFFENKVKTKVETVLIENYLKKQQDLYSEVNWRILSLFDCGDFCDNYIVLNLKKYIDLYGVEAKIKAYKILENKINKALRDSSEKELKKLINIMVENNLREQMILETKIAHYLNFGWIDDSLFYLLEIYFNKYNDRLFDICNALYFRTGINNIDKLLLAVLGEKVKNDTRPQWVLLYGLILEKNNDITNALINYDLYLSLYPDIYRREALQKLLEMRDKIKK